MVPTILLTTVILLAGVLALSQYGQVQSDVVVLDQGYRMGLRDAILEHHRRTEAWLNESDGQDVARRIDRSVLKFLSPEILGLTWVQPSLAEGNYEFAMDTEGKPYAVLIDGDGDREVKWQGKPFEVRNRVRILSEKHWQAGMYADDTKMGPASD